jgi:anti-sigma B factor antagonist
MSKIEKKDNKATITPEVDIVAGEVQNFRAELVDLINEKLTQITVDLIDVEMIDSSGIGVFISTQNTLKKANGALKVINVSADILKMFKIMRLDKHFEVLGKE